MTTTKKILMLLICLLSFTAILSCSKQADSKDSKGHAIFINDYKGKWVVINYWATWCKPCLKEMPELNALYLANRNNVMVLGVSYDKLSSDEINTIAKKYAIHYPMLTSFPLEKLGISRLDVLPITFILNPKGKLVKTLKGPQTEKQFRQAIGLPRVSNNE